MEFDKSRIYTAVNADELKVGSKCIFADTLTDLEYAVENGYEAVRLAHIRSKNYMGRFCENDEAWGLAYLVELPKQPKYKPFSSIEKAVSEIKKHGGWIQVNNGSYTYLLIGYSKDGLAFGKSVQSLQDLFDDFVFADTGTPCDELVEK